VIFNRLYKTILQENSRSQEELKQDFDRIKDIVLSHKYPKNEEEAREMGWEIIESSKDFAASIKLEDSRLFIRFFPNSVYMSYDSSIQNYVFYKSDTSSSVSESVISDRNIIYEIDLYKDTYEERWLVNYKTIKENPIPMSKQEREIGGKQKTIQSQLSNNRQQYHRYDNNTGSEKYSWTRRIIQDEM